MSTPRPWLQGKDFRASVIGSDGHIVADCLQSPHYIRPQVEREANASHIVKAVNAFDDLVAALELLEKYSPEVFCLYGLREALEKAKK